MISISHIRADDIAIGERLGKLLFKLVHFKLITKQTNKQTNLEFRNQPNVGIYHTL